MLFLALKLLSISGGLSPSAVVSRDEFTGIVSTCSAKCFILLCNIPPFRSIRDCKDSEIFKSGKGTEDRQRPFHIIGPFRVYTQPQHQCKYIELILNIF